VTDVMRLVRAEWRKTLTTRLVWGMLAGYVLYTVTNAVANGVFAGQQGTPGLDTPEGVRTVFASAAVGSVFTMLLGVLAVTTEVRHGTLSSTFLATPRRGRVVAAKLLALPVVAFGFAVVGVVVTVATALPVFAWRGVDVSLVSGDPPRVLAGALVGVTLYSVLGVGFGSLVRNQVAAVLVAVLWLLLAEPLLVTFLPEVGRWLPGGAASALTLTAPARGGDLLPVWAAALLLAGWGALLAALGARTTLRRDVS
jgi:ABC-2 type transport system permease protein